MRLSTPLRALIIGTSESDFSAVAEELRRGGFDPDCARIESAESLSSILRESWDVAIAECLPPNFGALEALQILRERDSDLPLIVVSGVVSEDQVQLALRCGACDYIPRSNLARLNTAVAREMRTAEGRRERQLLEQQFRHAQKMEAVGRLAGGVAHDFNNLLTIVSGYSELLLAGDHLDPGQRTALEEIRRASQRGGTLTRQLLAFSRRQPLAAKPFHVTELLVNMEKMLRRLIGEDIELVTLPAAVHDTVKTDPGQLEQVIMNIVVNARDAMPQGGKLTIECSDVKTVDRYVAARLDLKPGPYVLLSVTDTGVGMDAQVRSHIFEPFFTTKAPGKGTGLGLATAYGIIRQSGGNIEVASAPGRGTTMRIHLPRATEAAEREAAPDSFARSRRGCETVLVAEDEPRVRKLVCGLLAAKGYRVLEASRGEEAMRISETCPGPIHLAILDVVMPEMSGAEVGKLIAAARPDTRVLYMSGYTDEAMIRHGISDTGAEFLQKPFLPHVLACKVREILDGPPGKRTLTRSAACPPAP